MVRPQFRVVLTLALVIGCDTDDDKPGEAEGGATGASASTTAAPPGSTSAEPTSTSASTSVSGDSEGDGSTGSAPIIDDVPVEITFDEFDDGTEITDQYAEFAVFSSVASSFNETRVDGGIPLSEPNFICTYDDLCFDDTYVDFTHPVSALSFTMVGSCGDGAAWARVFVDGQEAAFVALDDPQCDENVTFALSDYQNVTRLELVDIEDDAGVGWDHFTFVAHVPR